MKQFSLSKPRDIGQIIGDTFTYIRVYHKSLFKPFLVYVLAPLLISVLLLGGGFGSIFGTALQNPGFVESDASSMIGASVSLIAGSITILITLWMLIGVIHQHLKHAANGEVPLDLGEFSRGMFSKSLVVVFTYIGLIVPLYLISIVITVFLQEFFFIGFVVFFPLAIYFVTKLLLFPTAYFVENNSPTDAIKRSWNLTEDNFWNTFGLYLIVAILFGILSYLFVIPLMVILGIFVAIADSNLESMLGILMGLLYGLMYFLQTIFSSAQFISLGLHYFNLRERKDGTELRAQIEELL